METVYPKTMYRSEGGIMMNIKKIALTMGLVAMLPIMGMGPSGIKNVGNNCFMNAGLQCLLMFDDLTHLLLRKECAYRPDSFTASYIDFLHSPSAEVLNPEQLWSRGWAMLKQQQGTSQDTDEFLTELFSHMIKEDLEAETEPQQDLVRLFNTKISSQISYAPTGFVSKPKLEEMIPLSIPLQQGDICLYQCLHHFFQPEIIDYDLDYDLPTQKRVKAQKQLFLEETGKYLVISLRRKIKQADGKVIRLNDQIAFPLQLTALNDYFSNPFRNPGTYDLTGVIMHSGDEEKGHYIAYIKRANSWYRCNDDVVTAVSQGEMEAIAQRGFGGHENEVATTFMYTRSSEPYALLQVDSYASPDEIERAYNERLSSIGDFTQNEATAYEVAQVFDDAFNQLCGTRLPTS